MSVGTGAWQWMVVEFTLPKAKRLPKWARSVAISPEGKLYVPAALAASEMVVMVTAGYDGTPVMISDDHLFVEADWMEREFPVTGKALAHIRASVAGARP